MWKAGQIVTIAGRVCQIKKIEKLGPVCRRCTFFQGPITICMDMCGHWKSGCRRLPPFHYFKFIRYAGKKAKSAISS